MKLPQFMFESGIPPDKVNSTQPVRHSGLNIIEPALLPAIFPISMTVPGNAKKIGLN